MQTLEAKRRTAVPAIDESKQTPDQTANNKKPPIIIIKAESPRHSEPLRQKEESNSVSRKTTMLKPKMPPLLRQRTVLGPGRGTNARVNTPQERKRGREKTAVKKIVNYALIQQQMDTSWSSFGSENDAEERLNNSVYLDENLQIGFRYYMPKFVNQVLTVLLPSLPSQKNRRDRLAFELGQFDVPESSFASLFCEYPMTIPQQLILRSIFEDDVSDEEAEFEGEMSIHPEYEPQMATVGVREGSLQKVLMPFLSELDERTRNMLVTINDTEANNKYLSRMLRDNQLETKMQQINTLLNMAGDRDCGSLTARMVGQFGHLLIGPYYDQFQFEPEKVTIVLEEDEKRTKKPARTMLPLPSNDRVYGASKSLMPVEIVPLRAPKPDKVQSIAAKLQSYATIEKQSSATDSQFDNLSKPESKLEVKAGSPRLKASRTILQVPTPQPTPRQTQNQSPEEQIFYLVRHERSAELSEFLHHHQNINLNYRNEDGETFLTMAAQVGDESILRQLLLAGANKHLLDNQGKTPFQRALAYQNYKVADLLLKDEIHII